MVDLFVVFFFCFVYLVWLLNAVSSCLWQPKKYCTKTRQFARATASYVFFFFYLLLASEWNFSGELWLLNERTKRKNTQIKWTTNGFGVFACKMCAKRINDNCVRHLVLWFRFFFFFFFSVACQTCLCFVVCVRVHKHIHCWHMDIWLLCLARRGSVALS